MTLHRKLACSLIATGSVLAFAGCAPTDRSAPISSSPSASAKVVAMQVPAAESTTQVIRYVLQGGFDGIATVLVNPLRDRVLNDGQQVRASKAAALADQYGQLLGVAVFPPDVEQPREGQESTNPGRATFQKGYVVGLEYTVRFTSGKWLLSDLKLQDAGKLNIPESSILPPPTG